eukprot:gb/GECG01012133.1/.p1 GENE.gb/GECG01012133.1/~~gb/GECG01012133.1/.p1  ORF type:complete len:981 (+),score=135.94 gb/GECG01012133.1/:1-2943(+)
MGCSDSKLAAHKGRNRGHGEFDREAGEFASVAPATPRTAAGNPPSPSLAQVPSRKPPSPLRLKGSSSSSSSSSSTTTTLMAVRANGTRMKSDKEASHDENLEIEPERRSNQRQQPQPDTDDRSSAKSTGTGGGGGGSLLPKQVVPPYKAASSSPNAASKRRIASFQFQSEGEEATSSEGPYTTRRSASVGKSPSGDKKSKTTQSSRDREGGNASGSGTNNGSELTISVPSNDRRASWGRSGEAATIGNVQHPLTSFDTMSEEHMKQKKLREFTRQCSQLTQYVFVSGEEVSRDYEMLRQNNIGLVVNTCRDVCKNSFESPNIKTIWDSLPSQERTEEPCTEDAPTKAEPKSIIYISLSVRDTMQEEITPYFFSAIEAIEAAAKARVNVLIHCHQGVSRSGTFALAYLMWARGLGWKQALETARVNREILSPNTGFLCQLMEWEAWMRLRWPHMVPSTFTQEKPLERDANDDGGERANSGLYDDVVVAQQTSSNKHALSPAHLWEQKESGSFDEMLSPGSLYGFEELPCIAPTPSLFAVTPIRRPMFISVPDYHGTASSGHALLTAMQRILEGMESNKTPDFHTRVEIGYMLQQCRSDKDRHRILPVQEKLLSSGVYVVVLPYSLIDPSEAQQLVSLTSSEAETEDEINEPLESHPVIWIGSQVQEDCRESMIQCARAEVRRWRTYMRSQSVDAETSAMARQYSSVDEDPVEIEEGSNLHGELVTLMQKVKDLTQQQATDDVPDAVGLDDAAEESSGAAAGESCSQTDPGSRAASGHSLKLGNITAAQQVQQHALSFEESNRPPPSPLTRRDPETERSADITAPSIEKPAIGVFSLSGTAKENVDCASGRSSGGVGEPELLEDYDPEDFESDSCRILCNSAKIFESPPILRLWVWFGSNSSELQPIPETLPQPVVANSSGQIVSTRLSEGQRVTARLVEAALPEIFHIYRGSLVECQLYTSVEWESQESETFKFMYTEGLQ